MEAYRILWTIDTPCSAAAFLVQQQSCFIFTLGTTHLNMCSKTFLSPPVQWQEVSKMTKGKSQIWVHWNHFCAHSGNIFPWELITLNQQSPKSQGQETKFCNELLSVIIKNNKSRLSNLNPLFPDSCLLVMEEITPYMGCWFKACTGSCKAAPSTF